MSEKKINYLPINLKEKQGQYPSIKMSGKTEDVIKALQAITNEKGYFNAEIQKRKEHGKYGETHYVKEDTWKPTETVKNETPKSMTGDGNYKIDDDSNDLPF